MILNVEDFNPAINYGPNDAGISAITIFLGIIGLLILSWILGKSYDMLTNFFDRTKRKDK